MNLLKKWAGEKGIEWTMPVKVSSLEETFSRRNLHRHRLSIRKARENPTYPNYFEEARANLNLRLAARAPKPLTSSTKDAGSGTAVSARAL